MSVRPRHFATMWCRARSGSHAYVVSGFSRTGMVRLKADTTYFDDPGLVSRFDGRDYRDTRAVPPFITRSTSASVAMLVSPGVVIASAPCAAPHSTAHCAPRPVSRP